MLCQVHHDYPFLPGEAKVELMLDALPSFIDIAPASVARFRNIGEFEFASRLQVIVDIIAERDDLQQQLTALRGERGGE